MKTLYEEIMKLDFPEDKKLIPELLDNSEIINIQNVADYFFEISNQETWALEKDFPNLAPPFENFWMEYAPTDFVNGELGKIKNNVPVKKVGILFAVKEISENEQISNEKWALNIVLFLKDTDNKIFQDITWVIAIDKLGKVTHINGKLAFMLFLSPALSIHMGIDQSNVEEKLEEGRYFMFPSIAPALLAVSFMHCKNVTVTANNPEKQKGKRLSRNISRIKYHTLQIEPMKKILRDEGDSENSGIKHALHICRGHFKDFSNGNGLFGKHQDMYWWNSQVRGSSKHGIVSKDYNVTAMENSNDDRYNT